MAVTFNERLTNAGSMAANITSGVAILDHCTLLCIQAVYTGSPVGTLKLQASANGVDWSDITNSSISVSAADNSVWNLAYIAYIKLRVIYTRTSGSGTLNIYANGKG